MSEDNDDAPSIGEAQDALHTVDDLREEAFGGVESSADLLDTASDEAHHANELLEDALGSVEEALEVVERLSGQSRRGQGAAIHKALTELEEPHDILGNEMVRFITDLYDALDAAEDGEGAAAGAVTIDGQVYQIELTPIGLDLPQSFNEYLRRKLEHNASLDAALIETCTDLRKGRATEILDGSNLSDDEVKQIVEFLHDDWSVTSEERTEALSRYTDEGGDPNLAALFEESE